jgi:hypothetical protein
VKKGSTLPEPRESKLGLFPDLQRRLLRWCWHLLAYTLQVASGWLGSWFNKNQEVSGSCVGSLKSPPLKSAKEVVHRMTLSHGTTCVNSLRQNLPYPCYYRVIICHLLLMTFSDDLLLSSIFPQEKKGMWHTDVIWHGTKFLPA